MALTIGKFASEHIPTSRYGEHPGILWSKCLSRCDTAWPWFGNLNHVQRLYTSSRSTLHYQKPSRVFNPFDIKCLYSRAPDKSHTHTHTCSQRRSVSHTSKTNSKGSYTLNCLLYCQPHIIPANTSDQACKL